MTGVGAENRNTTELRTRYRNCKKAGAKWIAMYVRTMSEVKGDYIVRVYARHHSRCVIIGYNGGGGY